MRKELNVLALIKGTERYLYVFDDENRSRILDVLRDHAANPELSLSWFDAAVLTDKAKSQEKAKESELPPPVRPDRRAG